MVDGQVPGFAAKWRRASGSRTALSDDAGGRTQVVGLSALVVVALITAFATADARA